MLYTWRCYDVAMLKRLAVSKYGRGGAGGVRGSVSEARRGLLLGCAGMVAWDAREAERRIQDAGMVMQGAP